MPVDYTNTIRTQYNGFLGREPDGPELTYWRDAFQNGGATTGGLDKILANTPDGHANLSLLVNGIYEQDARRPATPAEVAYWSGALASGGATLASFESALAAVPGAQANAERAYIEFFHIFQATDISIAQADSLIGGVDAPLTLRERGAATGSPIITTYIQTAIVDAYDTYVARDPNAAELSYWTGAFSSGSAVTGDLIGALATSSFGQARAGTLVASLYETALGRDPSADELRYWKAQVAGGETYNQITDLLQSVSTSEAVHHLSTTSGPDSIPIARGFGHVVVDGFNVAMDVLYFSNSTFFGLKPLDHAVQTIGPDNAADVLISVNAYETILLHHVALTDLQASNFLFA